LLEEGLAIVKAISDRYDGVRRNPWNQIEWGNHYTRAMASYSVLLALSGFRYSAVQRSVSFHPRLNPESFQCFFAAGSAWGLFSQRRQTGTLTAKIESRHGELKLQRVVLGIDAAAKVAITAPDGHSLSGKLTPSADDVQIDLSRELVIGEGQAASLVVSPAKP
jgi:hypothetical protein